VYDNLDGSASFEWENLSNDQYSIFIESTPYIDDRSADTVVEFEGTGWNFGSVSFSGATEYYVHNGSTYDLNLANFALEKDVIAGAACPNGITGGSFTVNYSTGC